MHFIILQINRSGGGERNREREREREREGGGGGEREISLAVSINGYNLKPPLQNKTNTKCVTLSRQPVLKFTKAKRRSSVLLP